MTSINTETVISTAIDYVDLDRHLAFRYVANAPFLTTPRPWFEGVALQMLTQSSCPKIGESYGEESREVSPRFDGHELRFGG